MQTVKNRNFHEVYKKWTGFHQVAGTIYCIMSNKIGIYSVVKKHTKKTGASLDY